MKINLRYIAADIINQVTNGKSLAEILAPTLTTLDDARDRAWVQATCFGVCRFYYRLDFFLNKLLKKPMQAKDSDVHALLCVGLYQLMEMRVATHAAVAETVQAVTLLKKPWAKGLVNAVLRSYLRRQNELESEVKEDEEGLYAHPQWMIDAMRKAWPQQWTDILVANNQHPPMSLRVVGSTEFYLEQHPEFKAKRITYTSNGIILEKPMSVEQIPGFNEGKIRVQDGASQLAAGLLDLQPKQHVLDACAAPGGKFAHIITTEPDLTLVAIEKEHERLSLIPPAKNAIIKQGDATLPKQWWDGQLFDRILLDAPCSASGIIRRHPDIKLLRQVTDIKALAAQQFNLLVALWPLLKPNGKLVYATCSIFPQENVDVLQAFLKSEKTAKEEKIDADWGHPCSVGRQILPGEHHMDGFYYGRLVKLS